MTTNLNRVIKSKLIFTDREKVESGFEKDIGSLFTCKCRTVLSLGEVFNLQWVKSFTEFGNHRVWSLKGFCTHDNLAYNTVQITSTIKESRSSSSYTSHELLISAGPHGEDGVLITFDPGTRIWNAKEQALEIIRQAYLNNKWHLHTWDITNGDICKGCLIGECANHA